MTNRYPRKNVPTDLNLANAGAVEKIYRELLDRPVNTAAALQSWLDDFSALAAAVDEYGSRR